MGTGRFCNPAAGFTIDPGAVQTRRQKEAANEIAGGKSATKVDRTTKGNRATTGTRKTETGTETDIFQTPTRPRQIKKRTEQPQVPT